MQPQPDPEQNRGQPSRLARALARGVEGFRQGFGDREYGMSREFRARYPGLAPWQPFVGPADIAARSIPAALRGAAGLVAGGAEAVGMSEANANRLQRDLNMIGNTFEPRRPNDTPESGLTRARTRMMEGWRQGFGERDVGIPADLLARYPHLARWQTDARDVDALVRSWPGLLQGGAGLAAGLAEDIGMSEAKASRLQRDLNAVTEVIGARRLGR
jgi:hypothetical protein